MCKHSDKSKIFSVTQISKFSNNNSFHRDNNLLEFVILILVFYENCHSLLSINVCLTTYMLMEG